MRALLVLLHRWAGLFIAAFLILSGLTGAVISWDHEVDEWLNADLARTGTTGPAQPTLDIVRAVEARHPAIQVSFAPLSAEPGHTLALGVEPRVNPATGALYDVDFNQVFIDPATGAELGRRYWGSVWPITRQNAVSFLYVLHYSLHMPAFLGIDRWGVWLMGIVALLWTIDCFTGFYLTLPLRKRARSDNVLAIQRRDVHASTGEAATGARPGTWLQRWRPAWNIRWRGGSYKLNFDLHRAFSLWTWGLLFVIAFTAFSLNLYREIFFPAMSLVSDVTPSVFDLRTPSARNAPIPPRLDFASAVERATGIARARGWPEPAGSIFYAREIGVYGVQFFNPDAGHGVGGAGHRTIHLDALDGSDLGAHEPWQGTAADLFVQAQFPLHSGRILGLPGRIMISMMGVVVAVVSITGVVIWWRKQGARNARIQP